MPNRKAHNIDRYEQSRVREYDGGERVDGDVDTTELWFFRAVCEFNELKGRSSGWYQPKSFELTGWRFVILDALSYLVHRLGYTRNSYDQDCWLSMQEAKDEIWEPCQTELENFLFFVKSEAGQEWS